MHAAGGSLQQYPQLMSAAAAGFSDLGHHMLLLLRLQLRLLCALLLQVIGREREVARVMQILARRTKNNPILLGEPGGQQQQAVVPWV
jgi:hypothetical protein